MPVSLTATMRYNAVPLPHSDVIVESRWKVSFSSLKNITLGGYEVGRSCEAPIETTIFLSPVFLAVNLMAFVMRLTNTDELAKRTLGSKETVTLVHTIEVGNNIVDTQFVIRDIHCVVKLDVLSLEFGLEYPERFAEFPLRPNLSMELAHRFSAHTNKHLPRGTSESIIESSFENERMSSTRVF